MQQYIHKSNGKIETKEINKVNGVFQPVLVIDGGVETRTFKTPAIEKRDFSKFEI